jgi:hypothetical protein
MVKPKHVTIPLTINHDYMNLEAVLGHLVIREEAARAIATPGTSPLYLGVASRADGQGWELLGVSLTPYYMMSNPIKESAMNDERKRRVVEVGLGVYQIFIPEDDEDFAKTGQIVIQASEIEAAPRKFQALNSIRCPEQNGGCGEDGAWRVALDRLNERVIADCQACGNYRVSLPLDMSQLFSAYTGPLDETGESVIK